MDASLLVSLALLGAVVACDIWVYVDVTSLEARGRPVVARLGTVEIADPEMRLILVIIVWVIFFPLYMVARRAS
jgi:hypothetical protein